MPNSIKELSDRELDAAVAERVMGEPQCAWWRVNGAGWWSKSCDHKACYPGLWKGDGPTIYLSNIVAAKRIVDKMRERGVWTQIQTFTHTTQVRVEMGVPSSECQEWGATMEEAICRCALRAVEKFELLAEQISTLKDQCQKVSA